MRFLPNITVALALAMAAPIAPAAAEPLPPGFVSLFDGRTLAGWRGDPRVWSVRDGAISATTDKALSHNTYLIHDSRFRNFEIRLKYRFLKEAGNSGLQFRSGLLEGDFVLGGLQANITPLPTENCGRPRCGPERFGMLYDELSRQELVMLGEQSTITRRQMTTGGFGQIVRTVSGTTNPPADILKAVHMAPEWNEVVVIAYEGRIVHAINNMVLFDAHDNDPLAPTEGLIGLQAHADGAVDFQFKDIAIKPLDSFPDISGRFVYKLQTLAEPRASYRDVQLSDGKLHVPAP